MTLLAHLARAVRGWRRIAPGPHPWWAAAVATLALGLPLAATMAAGLPLLAAPATFGALANLYGRTEPYARRWRTQAWTGLGLTAAVLAGAGAAAAPLTGWADVLVPALVVAAVAAVAKFVTDAVRTGPPAGLIPVFAAGTLTAQPLTSADLPAVLAVTVTCAAFAVALSAAAGLWRPDGPERAAVTRAVVTVLDADAPPGRALAAVHAAAEALGPRGHDALRGWLAHAERVLHARRAVVPEVRAHVGALRGVLPALAGRGAVPAPPAGAVPAPVTWPRRRVLRALRADHALRVPALRVGIACAAATLIATAVGFGHVYWAAVGAAAALQSPSVGVTTRRAVQRGAGTLVGVGLAALLVPLAADDGRLWALTVGCMFAVEFCMPRNYAVGTIAITGLSLLLTRLGTSGAGVATLVADRVGDTVLGVGVGVLVAVLVRNRAAEAAVDRAADAVREAQDPHVLRGHLLAVAEARGRWHDDDWRLPAARRSTDHEDAGHRRLGELLGAARVDRGTHGPARP